MTTHHLTYSGRRITAHFIEPCCRRSARHQVALTFLQPVRYNFWGI